MHTKNHEDSCKLIKDEWHLFLLGHGIVNILNTRTDFFHLPTYSRINSDLLRRAKKLTKCKLEFTEFLHRTVVPGQKPSPWWVQQQGSMCIWKMTSSQL